MTRTSSVCTIWVDVDDFFHYARNNPRPSGIQRVVHEILSVLEARAALRQEAAHIRFVRRGAGDEPFAEVCFSEISSLFERLSGSPLPSTGPDESPRERLPLIAAASSFETLRRTLIRSFEALPPDTGNLLLAAGVSQVRALRLLRRFLRPRHPQPVISTDAVSASQAASTPVPLACAPRKDDILLILGAAWCDPLFGERLRLARERYGVRPVQLIHDLIPARRPEWCHPSLVRDFRHWLETSLPQCSEILAISSATAHDVGCYAREHFIHLSAPVRVMPMGCGFSDMNATLETTCPGLPAPGTYILFVSTLEARKNHGFLLRVWRRLLSETGSEPVPTLVFAGRIGWLVTDLLQQLDNADWLQGKIRLIADPTDTELKHLYKNCLFTVFPSLFEGWGLPVTESLAMGAPCLASDVTSIPEAGGRFARYFDPDNVQDAADKIRSTFQNQDALAEWKNMIRTEFRSASWEAAADTLLDACAAAGRRGEL
ncbi:glycosyltransferase family 4 protein [Acetobacter conturbans]|uniref:Glycosyltransferase n=1 Tax=Acetobacter conturbans TaxID=1737472 RepID=A0ABX0JZC4_9PROT|nr:glycosyltransferase family 1 protein [Acetobacter conturbans]NHN87365.1 glycosyltransferase [Acetobacter conturbans]